MALANPLQFIQQVRGEVSKVVWPTRRETTVTTVMVFIMATIAAIFFFSNLGPSQLFFANAIGAHFRQPMLLILFFSL